MNKDQKESVWKSFYEVLETMAFMFCEKAEAEDFICAESESIQADMTFCSSEIKGKLSLVVPVEMCLEISANVLGKTFDDALRMVKATDAVKELVNITCGKMLTELFGDEEFLMNIPEASLPDPSIWEEMMQNPDTILCRADEWPVLLKAELRC